MADIAKILQGFRSIPNVLGALVVDSQGELVAADCIDELDAEDLGGVLMDGLASGDTVANALGNGMPDRQSVIYDGLQIMAERLAGGAYLVLALPTNKKVNYGRVRMEIKKNRATVQSCLS